jgi:mono/diheme cytochrome c family protein
MPSFAMLKDGEVKDIVEYVRWLSMRGEYEGQLNILLDEYHNKVVAEEIKRKVATYEADLEAGSVSKDKPPVTRDSVRQDIDKNLAEFIQDELPESIDGNADTMSATWREADLHSSVIYPKSAKPPATVESIARGRQYFLSKCAVCHGVTAEGNGENTRGYQKDPKGAEYAAPGFFDAWGQPIQPRNLNTGIYRGGRRPIDLYRRIHEGIPGTPMQGFASTFPEDQQIWDLVDYVMSIPIDGPLPKETATAKESAPAKAADPSVAQTGTSSAGNSE